MDWLAGIRWTFGALAGFLYVFDRMGDEQDGIPSLAYWYFLSFCSVVTGAACLISTEDTRAYPITSIGFMVLGVIGALRTYRKSRT